MTAAELRKAEAKYQRAMRRADAIIATASAERHAAIRKECEVMTQRQVAAIIGVTPGRVGQIATKGKP